MPKLIEYKIFVYDSIDSDSLDIEKKCFSLKRKVFLGLIWTEVDKAYGPITEINSLIQTIEKIKSDEYATIDISDARPYLKDHMKLNKKSDFI